MPCLRGSATASVQLLKCLELRISRANIVEKKTGSCALTGVAQWVERHPTNRKVAGAVPNEGTRLGCGPGPHLGVCRKQLMDVSLAQQCLSPSLPPFPFL